MLGSLNAPSGRSGYPSALVAVNKSATLPSSPPVATTSTHSTRSTHSTSATAGVASKSSSSAAPSPPLQLASATVKEHGGRVLVFGFLSWYPTSHLPLFTLKIAQPPVQVHCI